MRRVVFLVGVIAFSVSCGSSKPSKPSQPTDALERLANEACDCTTRACAEAANGKRDAAHQAYVEALNGKQPDEATGKKLDELTKRLARCIVEHVPIDVLYPPRPGAVQN